MTQMVYDAFRKQRELNLMLGLQSNVEIGGRSGFIFNTKHGRPIMPTGVNSFLKNIVNTYNKKESKLAEEETREPELMTPIYRIPFVIRDVPDWVRTMSIPKLCSM